MYSVAEVAKMLDANEETVRRWIRDGKLPAERRRGRKGSAITLEAVVEQVNRPPMLYMDSLIEWLDKNKIKYKKVELDASTQMQQEEAEKAAKNYAAAMGVAFGGPVGAVVARTLGKAMTKKKWEIVLDKAETEEECESDDTEMNLPEAMAEDVFEACETENSAYDSEENEIEQKIVDEKIKLIKLRQELARISAEITICEEQIEYYTLIKGKE